MFKKKFDLFFILFSLIIALMTTYFVSTAHELPHSLRENSVNRFKYLKESLPKISEQTEITTLFFGTSIFHYFLYPPDFDKELAQMQIPSISYNLAFAGNFGLGFYSLTNRLAEEFKGNNRKFKAVVIELSTASMNKRFYNRHKAMIDVGNPSIFMNNTSWLQMFIGDPPAAIYVVANKLFKPFNWFFSEDLSFVFNDEGSLVKNPRFAGVARFWSNDAFYEEPEWNIKNNGMAGWNFPTTRRQYEDMQNNLHKTENWNQMLEQYYRGNGLNKSGFLGYEDSLINYYIQAVKTAEKFADRVYLLKLPYSPEFQSRVDQFVDEKYAVNKIKNDTNAVLIDYTKTLNFKDADFADAMHLRHESMTLVMKKLAQDLQKDFNKSN